MKEPCTDLINLIGKKVNITPLALSGRIYEIQILRTGVCAWVRYLYNMDIFERCFYFDELEFLEESATENISDLLKRTVAE